jgi:CO dehydrogenase/acetyl-CoA synthase epsilon subunit
MITTKERKKKCDSNHILCSQTNMKGTTMLSDSEMAQKSRDSILLMGARVLGGTWCEESEKLLLVRWREKPRSVQAFVVDPRCR